MLYLLDTFQKYFIGSMLAADALRLTTQSLWAMLTVSMHVCACLAIISESLTAVKADFNVLI